MRNVTKFSGLQLQCSHILDFDHCCKLRSDYDKIKCHHKQYYFNSNLRELACPVDIKTIIRLLTNHNFMLKNSALSSFGFGCSSKGQRRVVSYWGVIESRELLKLLATSFRESIYVLQIKWMVIKKGRLNWKLKSVCRLTFEYIPLLLDK